LKVFEGHANSVLRVDWLGGDTEGYGQVVSAAADGLVKVWNSRTDECVATLDGHEDKASEMWSSFVMY
jgi:U3 small nucleolar RNA-associated protein 13